MGFKINTNVAALNSHTTGLANNRMLDSSLEKLSSGLRINKAADDSSGLAIADGLRSQASSLGQAINNANDAMGIIQTADKAMDEQVKILDTIKMKAIQSASDNQSADSRNAIQKDVNRLLEQLDNIALTTSFNGRNLLDGKFSNKAFQIGAYSNQTTNASIGNTSTTATGNITTKGAIAQLGNSATLTEDAKKGTSSFTSEGTDGLAVGDTIRIGGVADYKITALTAEKDGSATVSVDRGLETDLTAGETTIALVSTEQEQINMAEMEEGVLSDAQGFAVGDVMVATMREDGSQLEVTIESLEYDEETGMTEIGLSESVSAEDMSDLKMMSRKTLGEDFSGSDYMQFTVEGVKLPGVEITNENGIGTINTGLGEAAKQINLGTADHGIKAVAVVESNSLTKVAGGAIQNDIIINNVVVLGRGDVLKESDTDNKLVNSINAKSAETGVRANLEADGTLTLNSDGRAMKLEGLTDTAGINDGVNAGKIDFTRGALGVMNVSSEHFRDAGLITKNTEANTLDEVVKAHQLFEIKSGQIRSDDPVGLMRTREGSMMAMDLAETATKELDAIRSDLGSVQSQLVVTVNNISVTAVNVKAAESGIRDVDFAKESATFQKHNILSQSGSYAMSQANSIQQNVMRLLQ